MTNGPIDPDFPTMPKPKLPSEEWDFHPSNTPTPVNTPAKPEVPDPVFEGTGDPDTTAEDAAVVFQSEHADIPEESGVDTLLEETPPADEIPESVIISEPDPASGDTTPVEEDPETLEEPTISNPAVFEADLRAFQEQNVPSPNDLDQILLIKSGMMSVIDGLEALEANIGSERFLREVMTVGSDTNLFYRYIFDTYVDAYRTREIFASLPKDVRDSLSPCYTDPNSPKRQLRRFIQREHIAAGNTVVDGDDAYRRMMGMDGDSGRGLFPLYESGIAIGLIVPQNSDFDSLFSMLAADEIAQYTNVGLEGYNLTLGRMKEITLNWVRQFITYCSYTNWAKSGALNKIITLNDFEALLVYLAHLCNPDGFDRFIDKCFRPIDKDHPRGCDYHKQITICPGDLVVTRFPLMTEQQLAYMFDRIARRPVTMAEIDAYKKGFDFSHKVFVHREWTLTMDTPSMERYIALSSASWAASYSTILGGNTPAVLQDMTSKNFRDVSLYVSSITKTVGDKSLTTTNVKGIMELIGRISDEDLKKCDPDDTSQWILQKIADFIQGHRLTYVGLQSKPCPKCGYVDQEADGWTAVDPLRVFFTTGRSTQ